MRYAEVVLNNSLGEWSVDSWLRARVAHWFFFFEMMARPRVGGCAFKCKMY